MTILSSLKSLLFNLAKVPPIDLLVLFLPYVLKRIRQVYVFVTAALEVLLGQFAIVKSQLVSRMFWGRGSLYRTSFHLLVTIFTSVLLLVSLVPRFFVNQAQQQSLSIAYGTSTNADLLQQGASIGTVFALDRDQPNYGVSKHRVASGETLQSIADSYAVSKDTIKWANDKLLSPFNDNVKEGWELQVPEIDGVLYTVKSTDNLDKIVAYTQGNRFDIIELNQLVPPNYDVAAGQSLFVPNGKIKPPPPPPPTFVSRTPGSGGYVGSGVNISGALGSFPTGAFDDPLTHPLCAGYIWQRGFLPWHDGVDLSKGSGCPVRAIAAGTVVYAGWKSYGSGYTVIIDHGGSVQSQYLHGDGNIWVKSGDYVQKGQDIMYMGCTGNCTGTHLHLTLKYNGYPIDPSPFVPYRR